MKLQVKRALKSQSFMSTKNYKKAWKLCLKVFHQYEAGASVLYFKTNTLLFYCPFLFKEFFNPQVRINKLANEHKCQLPSQYHQLPSLNSRMYPLKFTLNPLGRDKLIFCLAGAHTCLIQVVHPTFLLKIYCVKPFFQVYSVKEVFAQFTM